MQKFKTGMLVRKSDHYRREHCVKDDAPHQYGIITEIEFFEEDGAVVCYPVVHWQGNVMPSMTHPLNATVVETAELK